MRKDTSANTLHIWTSRTGVHTIEKAMETELGANSWIACSNSDTQYVDNWKSVEDIKNLPENNMWKFAYVRNPWDREYSVYCFSLKSAASNTNFLSADQKAAVAAITFDQWVTFRYSSSIDTALIANSDLQVVQADKLVWCQHKGTYVGQIYYANGSLGVDAVGYYEDFANEWTTKIASVKGYTSNIASIQEYSSADAKANTDYRNVYNANTKQLIADYYADDIATFGYSYDDGPGVKPTSTIPTSINVASLASTTRFSNNHFANVDVIGLLQNDTTKSLPN